MFIVFVGNSRERVIVFFVLKDNGFLCLVFIVWFLLCYYIEYFIVLGFDLLFIFFLMVLVIGI